MPLISAACSSDPAIRRMREAEQELWTACGIQDLLHEEYLPLRPKPALMGLSTARVFTLTLPNHQKDNNEDKQIPILFVHGGGGTAGDWANLLPHLAKPGRTIYSVERPGNGLSEPLDYSNCSDLGEFSHAFLGEVINALQLSKVHLVGNSLGGGTVLWYSFAQARQGSYEKVASVSALGVPAGFQGMICPPKVVCWLVNTWLVRTVASMLPPYLPFLPTLVLVLVLGIPYSALPSVFTRYAWRSFCIPHNLCSFLSIFWPLWEASRNGRGWKLTELSGLSEKVPVLITEGKGEVLLTRSHRAEFLRQLGPERYLYGLGQGHAPWVSDPIQYARVLEQFWKESEIKGNDDEDSATSWEPIRLRTNPVASPRSVAEVFGPDDIQGLTSPAVVTDDCIPR